MPFTLLRSHYVCHVVFILFKREKEFSLKIVMPEAVLTFGELFGTETEHSVMN